MPTAGHLYQRKTDYGNMKGINLFNYTLNASKIHLPSGILALTLTVSVAAIVTAREITNNIDALVSIQRDQPKHRIPPTLWGIFFEEINHAGEGGLYAEMVKNRSFEAPSGTNGWSFYMTGQASGHWQLETTNPLNSENPTSIKLVRNPGGDGQVGISNNGYWGMYIESGQRYKLRFHARCSPDFIGGIIVQLQSANGSEVYAQRTLTGLTTNWQKFEAVLQPSATSTNAALTLSINQPGTVWLDVVSLFPENTFNNRTNGLRRDLAQMLLNLKPSFVRFPGGCYVEGHYLSNAFNWKNTIGDIAERRGHLNDVWGYYSSDGLGYHEYLQMCEDLGAEPLFVINCGMSHNEVVPLDKMGPYVQAALDAIEYANGPTNSYWGALRAANGHPEPFNLKYIQIGNENGGPAYNERYALFYDAIKSRYPDVKIIACDWGGIPTSRPVEIRDEHYYNSPAFFINNATKYDSYNRSGPKVFVGEYAVTSGCGIGNLIAALAEAAFMTGLERNSDVVIMAAYAPLFANVNAKVWNPDLIYFDNHRVVGTPSYYVQMLFSQNRGHVVLPTSVKVVAEFTNPPPYGAIGLGSWNTAVEYTNVTVISNGVVLYQSDFSKGASEWKVFNGTWIATNGVYRQTNLITDCRSTTGQTNWSNYTITLKAKKLHGSEGFLIIFNWQDDNNWTWWNIGGWNNTQHAIEHCEYGGKSIIGEPVRGSILANRWYDIRVELNGDRIRCYLDNKLIHDATYPKSAPFLASSTYDEEAKEIILKAVNVSAHDLHTSININGSKELGPIAHGWVLTAQDPLAENTLENPTNVVPVRVIVTNVNTNFVHKFPARSLTILRLREKLVQQP